MKLHEALRKICSESGNIAIQKKSLVYELADLHAFDEYPETREAVKALTAGGFAKELYRLSLRKDPDEARKWLRADAEGGFSGTEFYDSMLDSLAEDLVRHNPELREAGQEDGESPDSIDVLRRMCAMLREAMSKDSDDKN